MKIRLKKEIKNAQTGDLEREMPKLRKQIEDQKNITRG